MCNEWRILLCILCCLEMQTPLSARTEPALISSSLLREHDQLLTHIVVILHSVYITRVVTF
jgi:hypothetical protein